MFDLFAVVGISSFSLSVLAIQLGLLWQRDFVKLSFFSFWLFWHFPSMASAFSSLHSLFSFDLPVLLFWLALAVGQGTTFLSLWCAYFCHSIHVGGRKGNANTWFSYNKTNDGYPCLMEWLHDGMIHDMLCLVSSSLDCDRWILPLTEMWGYI